MKGVSPVVAILLLTLITLAIAGMTYISYTGITDLATKSDDKLPESFKVVSTSENMVYLKNTGTEAIDVPLFFTEDGPVDVTRGCELLEPDEICGYGLDIDYGVHEVTIGGESSEKTILYVGVEKPRLDVPTTTIIPLVTVTTRPPLTTTTLIESATTTTLPATAAITTTTTPAEGLFVRLSLTESVDPVYVGATHFDRYYGGYSYTARISNRGEREISGIKIIHKLGYGTAFNYGARRCIEFGGSESDICRRYEEFCRLIEAGVECDLKDNEGNFIVLNTGEFATSSIYVQAVPAALSTSDTIYAISGSHVSNEVTESTGISDRGHSERSGFDIIIDRRYLAADAISSAIIKASSMCEGAYGQPCPIYFSAEGGKVSSAKCDMPYGYGRLSSCSIVISSSETGTIRIASYHSYAFTKPKISYITFVEPCNPDKKRTISIPASYDAEIVNGMTTITANPSGINMRGADSNGYRHEGIYRFSGIGVPSGSRIVSASLSLYQSGGCVVSSFSGDSPDKFGFSEFVPQGQNAPLCEPITASGILYTDLTQALSSKALSQGIDELTFGLGAQAWTELVGSGSSAEIRVRGSSDFDTGSIENGNPAKVDIEYCEP
ncbi:MAG: hypothetical protein HY364_00385 [Candidatus Aenigmarchaeota archaeon]|nr:hypothetical protein [Candidatus Aenigmarchaeota archaeon]